MHTIAYGAATIAPNFEKFFANPVRGVFAVVEAFGVSAEPLSQAIIDLMSAADPDEERFLSLLQYQVNAALKDFLGRSAVSFVLAVCEQNQKIRLIRAGASASSLVCLGRLVPIMAPQLANPRALMGEEVAIPGCALGLSVAAPWSESFVTVKPGEVVALHSSSLPIFAPELQEVVGNLLAAPSTDGALQAEAEAVLRGEWRGVQAVKGATLVLFKAP